MGRLRSRAVQSLLAILSLWSLWGMAACGGHSQRPLSPYPAKINLIPANQSSVQLGSTFNFSASAQNANGTNVNTTFTFTSSDTTVLNIAPNGVGCAGRWDAAFTTCTPGNIGVVTVTASALGAISEPTYIFVHPLVDNITVTGVILDGVPVQEPCLPQGKSMTLQAAAFSQGVDVTSSVGPFNWSANNPSVVTLKPIVNSAYNFPTNQLTATAFAPGLTEIYASASGVSSTTFRQPALNDSNNNPIPVVFDFFETCPIQNIALELNRAGSGQTSFITAKGASSSESVVATVTDVMGNSSLPNTSNGVVLSRVQLTWTASQPAVVGASGGCLQSCAISTPSPGAGTVTASCTPPTCNIGFPKVPAALATPTALATCAQYFPPSCEQYIPLPVYASPLPLHTTAAISGVVTGSPAATSILATSFGCADVSPEICATGIYSPSSAKAQTGTASPLPDAPNSLLFDLSGDKVYMGSDFGAQIINPANFGTSSSPFIGLGTVTGHILAISTNGNVSVFSDTLHTPNQVYVVDSTTASSPTTTALNINGASAAAFSRDGLKVFIYGFDSNNNPTLYVYSALQSLQALPLPAQTTVNSIVFSANGAFAYVAEPVLGGVGPAITVYNTCDNQIAANTFPGKNYIPLASTPIVFKALPDGVHFLALESNGTLDYITSSITGIPAATLTQPAQSLCPQTVTHTVKNIDLGQGSIHPINFFVSADSSLIYVVASNSADILVYDVGVGAVTAGIPLKNNAVPLSADISADDGTIVIGGSDGQLHEVTTTTGGNDAVQLQFPNLANYLNPFCTFTPAAGQCTLNFVAARP